MFVLFFFLFKLLILASLLSWLAFCVVVVRQFSPEAMRGIVQARQSMGQMCPSVWMCVLVT